MNFKIGEKLKAIRQSQNISLDEAAGLTGVSKPMLGQIERGQSVPTVTTLWKIAVGLKTPLSLFLEEQQEEYSIAEYSGKEPITEENGKMRAYPLFVYDPIRSIETFYIEFDSGCRHASEKHSDGVEEYIFILKGKLQIVLNGKEIIVGKKQAMRFRADVPHEYNNPFSSVCTVYNTIYYPHRRNL